MSLTLGRPRPTPIETIVFVAGGLIAIEALTSLVAYATSGTTHPKLTTPWALTGILGPLMLLLLVAREFIVERTPPRFRPISRAVMATFMIAFGVFVIACCLWILNDGHRRFTVVFAVAQALLMWRCFGPQAYGIKVATLTIALFSWLLSIGMTYIAFGDALLSALPDTNMLIFTFCIAFVFMCIEFVPRDDHALTPMSRAMLALSISAIAFFVWQGLRTDDLLTDWIPYHRSYYTTPAEFVRQGHWLLWEVPSQYGFLSILYISRLPGDAWESLFLGIAAILVVQAWIGFRILTEGTQSIRTGIVAIVLVGAANFSATTARLPFGPRLYPQGGMRFIFVIALMYVAFRMYRAGSEVMRDRLRALGTAIWAVGCFWAFENVIWTTIMWLGFLVVELVVDAFRIPTTQTARRLAARLTPAVAFPLAILAIVDVTYASALHHLPDWLGYIEFSSIYSSDSSYGVKAITLGGGWLFVVLLAALGTQIISMTRAGRLHAVPVLVIAWLAAWSTSSYYFGEAFANHVSSLAPIIVVAIAICYSVGEWERVAFQVRAGIAFALVPYCVLISAFAVSGTRQLFATRGPLMHGYHFRVVDDFPTIPRELAQLEHKAGINASDLVLFPSNTSWVKLSDGLIPPFVQDPATGRNREQLGWLPYNQTGMINTMITLPVTRHFTYIERFLARSRSGGWYITYHQPADCSTLSPHLRTERTTSSLNFTAALCTYDGRTNRRDVLSGDVSR